MVEINAQIAFDNACNRKNSLFSLEKLRILGQIDKEAKEGKMQTKVNIEKLGPEAVNYFISYLESLGFKVVTTRVKSEGFQGVTLDLYLAISWDHVKKGENE